MRHSLTVKVNENQAYGQPQIDMESGGKDIVVISDLHLASGCNPNGNYGGTENFFSDESFVRFLQYLTAGEEDKKKILIINGDFIDFLRVLDYPSTTTDFEKWEKILKSIGISKPVQELRNSITKKEKDYGLKTNDYKSVYKLYVSVNGHRKLFEQIALWVRHGNQLVIVKGNHDLEWYWPAVQDYLRCCLAQFIAADDNANSYDDIINQTTSNVLFIDNSVVIDGKIHIEHGHIYENITSVTGAATLNNNTELNLPFGSFFNRYLVNRLEVAYPFLDNVRPTQKILPLLIRERFPLALKVLFKYIPFTLLIIPKKMYWQAFKYLFDVIVIIILPVAITGYAIWVNRGIFEQGGNGSFFSRQIFSVLKNFGFLFLSYIFGRLLSMARLSAPKSLFPFAKSVFEKSAGIQIVTFGHSHTPQQFQNDGRWYYNTGTWMPVYDISMADVRLDKTFTYLFIQQDNIGNIKGQQLLRWNDDALRPELMILKEQK
jgi:UDP-2,3-diacylglucosamine pyrophosphatase LpxH